MKKVAFTLLLGQLLLTWSCADVETRKPFGGNDEKAPGVVTLTGYTPTPGGAVIKFIAPPDEDLMYVKVKYTLDNGKPQETRASLYSDEVAVEGFGNTQPKTLAFSAVDRHDNESAAVTYEIVPGASACQLAYDSLSLSPTFGGVYVQTKNLNRKILYIDVSTTDSLGGWYTAHTEYTSMSNIGFAVRGFANVQRQFRVVVRDVFENESEAFEDSIVPVFEQKLDLTKFREVILPNDIKMNEAGQTGISALFNGNNHYGERNLAHSADFMEFPVWFTFDMGVKANISRYVYWQRLEEEWLYDHGNMKTWEIWGTSGPLDPSGSWENGGWKKLMDCESIKPSGLPVGQHSIEDIEYATRGEEFMIPPGMPPVRYIRIKLLSTFQDRGLWHLQQLWFWGQVVEE
jgi:hypothetical protein